MKNLHVMLVSNTAASLWQFRRVLIADIIASGGKVTCLTAEDGTSEKLIGMGADFKPISMTRSGLNPVKELLMIGGILMRLLSLRPDYVVSYTIKPNSYVPVLARFLNIPSLAVVTGLGYAFLKEGFVARTARAILKNGLRFARQVWFLNQDDLDILGGELQSLRDKSAILPGEGVDVDLFDDARFPSEERKHLTFLMIARVLRDKGVVEFAEAARLVKQDYPEARFQLLGQIDPANPAALTAKELDELCVRCGMEYLGTTADVRPFIAKSDICVLPSYREGIPLALLEGASMRRPIIATDVAGCRDVVRDGMNGFLVPPKDINALVQAMVRMINLSSEQLHSMKEASRKDILDRFSNEIVLDRYRRLFQVTGGHA